MISTCGNLTSAKKTLDMHEMSAGACRVRYCIDYRTVAGVPGFSCIGAKRLIFD